MAQEFGIATKAIIKNDEGKFLVVSKSEIEDINPNEIDIPGGRLEFGEKVEDGLIREIMEEVNLEVEILRPSRTWGFVRGELHLVGITFLAKYISGEIKLSGEHNKFAWVSQDEILNGNYSDWIKEEFKNVR